MTRRALAAFPALLLGLLTSPALADGFIMVEPPRDRPPPPGGMFPLAVERHDVTVTIDGQVATTSVDQVFRNPLDQRLEGIYMFPLPEDAAVDGFSLWIDDQEMQGEVLDRGKALDIYEGIVRRMKDPALLEYAGRGMFKLRIFPIEPRSTRRVRLRYRQVLTYEAGRCRYVYPLNTEKFSSAPLERCSVVVDLKSEIPLKGIYSPWQDVDVRRSGERSAKASWEATQVRPNRDFVLDFDVSANDVGLSLRTHAVPGEDGTFLLIATPKAEMAPGERVAKDVVFVLDTSGSMAQDDRMDQARRALQFCIGRLAPEDRFAVVDFATDARAWKEELQAASPENREAASAYVKGLVARGGTAIDEALARALRYRGAPDPTRPFTIVFLTDGQPTIGETEPDAILANANTASAGKAARIFVWGVGKDLNTHLLDQLALDHGGDRHYVLPGEDIEVGMSAFYDTIASPVLTDLELSFEGAVRVSELLPRRLPDLFHGRQLVVVGRFTGEGQAAVRLKGKLAGQPREFVWEGPWTRTDDNPHVPVLWAKRRIGFLLDEIRLHGESAEVKDEVVRLARRYGLPTPYTSYLVLEEGALAHRGGRDGRPVPPGTPAPEPSAAPSDAAAQEAFGRLRREAAPPAPPGAPAGAGGGDFARAGGGDFARAPTTRADGEDAVRLARDAERMNQSEKADVDEQTGASKDVVERSIRTIADHTFYLAGDTWVDSTSGPRTPAWKTITQWSDEHFALLRAHPELGPFLALGKIILRVGDVVYEVKA